MKGLESLTWLAEAPALEELQLLNVVAVTEEDAEALARHPGLRTFSWFDDGVPRRVSDPVFARLGHLEPTRPMHPEQWLVLT